MKILFVISAAANGGAEILACNQAVEISKKGKNVAVCFVAHAQEIGRPSSEELFLINRLNGNGIDVYFLGVKAKKFPLLGILRLNKIVREFSPEVIVSHLYFGVVFSILNQVRIYLFHHTDELNMFRRIFLNLLPNKIIHVFISRRQIEKFANYGLSFQNNLFLPNSVDTSVFKYRYVPGKKNILRVVSVAGIRPEKNLVFALNLVSSLASMGVSLTYTICGEPKSDFKKTLEPLIISLGIKDLVNYSGGTNDICGVLESNDMFLLTSLFEGYPLSLIEATCVGLYCISSNVGECKWHIDKYKCGLAIDGFDLNVWAELIFSNLENIFKYRQNSLCSSHEELSSDFQIKKFILDIEGNDRSRFIN